MRSENTTETTEVVATTPAQKTIFGFKKVFIYRASAIVLGAYVTMLGIAPAIGHILPCDPGQPW